MILLPHIDPAPTTLQDPKPERLFSVVRLVGSALAAPTNNVDRSVLPVIDSLACEHGNHVSCRLACVKFRLKKTHTHTANKCLYLGRTHHLQYITAEYGSMETVFSPHLWSPVDNVWEVASLIP